MCQHADQHLSINDVERYLSGDIGEDEALSADSHLGICSECAEQVRVMRRLMFLFHQWTAKTHAQAYQQLRLLKAIEKAAEEAKEYNWRQRLREWSERWAGRAEAATQVILRVPEEVTRVITEGMEGIAKPDSRWQFTYAEVPVRMRGKGRSRTRKDRLTVEASGPPAVKVSVNPSSNEIRVQVRGLVSGERVPLVLLISDTEGVIPLVAEPKFERQTDCYVARFESVPSGKYFLVFEPPG